MFKRLKDFLMDKKEDVLSAEERAELKILSANMRTIIYYYNELNKKLKEQNDILEKLNNNLKVVMRR